MALYVNISINEQVIRTYGVQNITPHLTKQCTYRICKYVDKGNGTSERVYLDGVIYHKKEDGAVILAKKLLDFVIEMGEK